MGPTVTIPVRRSRSGEPAWELLDRLPCQGDWTEFDFRRIDAAGTELTDGTIEVLPVPTWVHQTIALILCNLLNALGGSGRAVMSPFKLRVRRGRWREPDVAYLLPASVPAYFRNDYWEYADLVIEVVSPDDPDRDYVEKRAAYAEAKVPEYWIVDPDRAVIVQLVLDGTAYREAGRFGPGQQAASLRVPGFTADVGQLVAQATAGLPPAAP